MSGGNAAKTTITVRLDGYMHHSTWLHGRICTEISLVHSFDSLFRYFRTYNNFKSHIGQYNVPNLKLVDNEQWMYMHLDKLARGLAMPRSIRIV